VKLAQGYDVGLSVEDADVMNRHLCLGNKIFTYLAAGVPVLMTATPAQSRLAAGLDGAAVLYNNGDIDALAELLTQWNADATRRCAAAHAARAAAERRWHWEHAEDRGALLRAFHEAVG
jgi:glycosyltransferase involved in cell wall biosynthesis